MVGTPPHFQFPASVAGPFLYYSFFSYPTQFLGDFSWSFKCPKYSANVQQALCETVSFVGIFLMYLLRETNSASFYSTILTAAS